MVYSSWSSAWFHPSWPVLSTFCAFRCQHLSSLNLLQPLAIFEGKYGWILPAEMIRHAKAQGAQGWCYVLAKRAASKASLFHGMQEDSVKHWLRTLLDSMMNVVCSCISYHFLISSWMSLSDFSNYGSALLSICERPACARAESLSDHASADLGGIHSQHLCTSLHNRVASTCFNNRGRTDLVAA